MPHSEREPRPVGWAMAYRYNNRNAAKLAYEMVRNDVLVDDGADASVFRVMLEGLSYVAVVAEAPPPEHEQERAASVLTRQGVPATLPTEVLKGLQDRRRAFKSTGLDYFERRT